MAEPSSIPSYSDGWVVAVIGTTAAGKTRLSLDLATQLRSRFPQRECVIMSVDSMQIYRGLDVASAKATVAERQSAPHLLLDLVDVWDASFSVSQFQKEATAILKRVWTEKPGTIVIVVGGTHLWLEALLWPDIYSLSEEVSGAAPQDCGARAGEEIRDEEQTPALFSQLLAADPERAKQLHPNARRKIIRSLAFIRHTGQLHSVYLTERARRGRILHGGLRYRTCFLWVASPEDVLRERIRSRVDSMVSEGLEAELAWVELQFVQRGLPMDYSLGALQAIGIKEFAPWFKARQDAAPAEQQHLEFVSAVQRVKTETLKYAKRQLKWIRGHLVERISGAVPLACLYKVDSTRVSDKSDWLTHAILPASDAVVAFFQDDLLITSLPESRLISPVPLGASGSAAHPAGPTTTLTCEICNTVVQDSRQMEAHVKGKPHKARKARQHRGNRQVGGAQSAESRQ